MLQYVDSRGMLAYEHRPSSDMIELPSVPETDVASDYNSYTCCVTPIRNPSVTSVNDVKPTEVGSQVILELSAQIINLFT